MDERRPSLSHLRAPGFRQKTRDGNCHPYRREANRAGLPELERMQATGLAESREPIAYDRRSGRAGGEDGSGANSWSGRETLLINMQTLSIVNGSIPDGVCIGVPEPERGEVELTLANAMHQLDA
jgi:hypothetical protein